MLTAEEQHHVDRVLDPTPVWHADCARLKAIIKRLDCDLSLERLAWLEQFADKIREALHKHGYEEQEGDEGEGDVVQSLKTLVETVRLNTLEEAAKEAKKERTIFFTRDDIPHQERDLRVRKQMRNEIAKVIRAMKDREVA